MEVKPGYKQTEVGVIPEEWNVMKLGELCTFTQGVQIAQSDQIRHARLGYIRYLYIRDFFTDNFEWFVRDQYPSKIMAELDIMMVNTGSTAGAVFTGARGVLSNNAFRIRFDQEKLARGFLFLFLSSPATQNTIREFANAAAQPHVGHKNIAQVPIGFPEIKEQRAIATALSDVDGLLGGLDRLIAKKRDLKQAAMQQLLTGQTRLPGFHGEWEVKRLGDVISHCFSGATPRRNRPEFYKGNVRWITSGELNYNLITDTLEKITSEAVVETNLTIHPVGTFLMAITGLEAEGTRGACGIIGAPSTTNQSCMAVFPKDALAGEYLFHYYVFRGKSLALQYCQGTKQQSYTASLVKQLPIDLPPTLPEQTAIAEVLTEMDAELAALEQRREKTRALKQAMMQELLTGRIRLV